jgi:hypothetical protein
MKFFTVHKDYKRVSEEATQIIEKCKFKIERYGSVSEIDLQDIYYILQKIKPLIDNCINANLPADAAALFIQASLFSSILESGQLITEDSIETTLKVITERILMAKSKKEKIAWDFTMKQYRRILQDSI